MSHGENQTTFFPEGITSKDGLVERYSPVVYAATIKVLSSRESSAQGYDADDMSQEVFLRLFKDDNKLLRSYNPQKSAFSTWLTIVTRSTVISCLRKKRLSTVPLEENLHAVSAESPAYQAEKPDNPTSLIPPGLLSPRQELVLKLFYDKEMAVSKISNILSITEQTVRSCRHKAIEKLRKFLKK